MYRVRSYKKYPSRKRSNNELFFPSRSNNYNRMSYYQKKGMIIQKSPRLVFNPPTEIMSKEKLDSYYRTLLAFKYKFPATGAPDTLPPFILSAEFPFEDFFPNDNNKTLDPMLFGLMAENILYRQYPALYPLYTWGYELFQLQFTTGNQSGGLNTQFHVDWTTNLLENPFQIFMKTVDAEQASGQYSNLVSVSPSLMLDYVSLKIVRITVAAGGAFSSTSVNQISQDPDITDNGNYALLSTLSDAQYNGTLSLVVNSGSDYANYRVRAFFICYGTKN